MAYLDTLDPRAIAAGVAALLALLACIVAFLNRHGRRLRKHDDWLRVVNLRLDNLNKARAADEKRQLQTARPPSLSEAATVQVTEDMLHTLRKRTKEDPTQ